MTATTSCAHTICRTTEPCRYGMPGTTDDEARAASTVRVIEQTHAWGDCIKHGDHCHCSIEVAAINAGEARTCRHCLAVVEIHP